MGRYNITYPTTLVLHAVADGVRYGFDIADRTGLQTGTVGRFSGRGSCKKLFDGA